MAGASSKEQWKLVDDQFLDSQGAIDDIRCWLIAYVEQLSLERNLESDTAAWILQSMDTPTLFRFYKRKKFSIPATQDALKKNINWRIDTIPSLPVPSPSSLMRFMPEDATDYFGRPILVLRARYLSGQTVEGLKNQVLSTYELARLHIADLFQSGDQRVLQLVVIVDLQGLTIRDVPMDMMSWFANVPIVHYPGMCAACYILNFSWAFNGMWSIVKRLLPQRAIARIFFPKRPELLEFLPKSSLLQEYEGDLPPFDEKRDLLMRKYLPEISTSSEDSSSSDESSLASSTTAVTSTSYTKAPRKRTNLVSDSKSLPPPDPPVVILPSRSPHNPFFGYPVQLTSSNSIPQLSYGRRRKRDLARTLLVLYLRRISLVLQRSLRALVPFLKQKAQAPAYYYYYDYTEGRTRRPRGTTMSLWFWWSIIAWVAGSFGRAVYVLKSEGLSSGQAIVMTLKDMIPTLMDAVGLGNRRVLTCPLVAC